MERFDRSKAFIYNGNEPRTDITRCCPRLKRRPPFSLIPPARVRSLQPFAALKCLCPPRKWPWRSPFGKRTIFQAGRLRTLFLNRSIRAIFLIADITSLNFNVTFEIGYSIGIRKRVYLVRNGNFRRDATLTDAIGIFDTLGFDTYVDELTLATLISQFEPPRGIPLGTKLNVRAPVYVLQTPQSSTAMIAIISRIKKSRLGYRGYIPSDEARLSAAKAMDDVSQCLGTVIPLLPLNYVDATIHNIRAAFLAGLSKGLQKETLIL